MIPVRIMGTGTALPERCVTTQQVAEAVGRAPAEMELKTGIKRRYWAAPGQSMAELGAQALRLALEQAGLAPTALRRLLFVSSTGGDALVPATANRVSSALGLSGSCDAIDLNNACMGFLSAFDLAARSVATGLHPVAIVTVEFNSRALCASEPRPYLVFGDAAAAVVLGPGPAGGGVLAATFGNDGSQPPDTALAHPLATGCVEGFQFHASPRDMVRIAFDALDRATQGVVAQSGMSLSQFEWFLPHQPNGAMLRGILERYGVEPARILMLGVGAGVSYGAIAYQVGA